MYQPGVIPTTYSTFQGSRSRVVTGPAPRLTAPLMRQAVTNPGGGLLAQATAAYTQGAASGELVIAEADARPGGAPFPAVHSMILGFDVAKARAAGPGDRTRVLKKGQLVAIFHRASAIKASGPIPRNAKGFVAKFKDEVVEEDAPHYIGVIAEQITFDCHNLVPVTIAVEHTITLSKEDFHPSVQADDLIPGTALVIAVKIQNDGQSDNLVILKADQLQPAHIPYKSAIVTVNDTKDRIQACLTADHLNV
jgi:hypothetical protein